MHTHIHTHTHPFNGSLSKTTWVSRYQKGKNQSGFYWSKRQWVAVASAGPYASLHLAPDIQPHQYPTTQFFTGRMPFLPSNRQRQSTEGNQLPPAPATHSSHSAHLVDLPWRKFLSPEFGTKFQREVTLFLEVSEISLQQSCGIGGKSLCQNQLDSSSHFDTYRHLWWTNGWIDRRTHDSSIYHTSIESCSKKVHVIISQIILSKINQF